MHRIISLLGGVCLLVVAGCAGSGTGDTPTSSTAGTPPPVRESTTEPPATLSITEPSATPPETTDTMTPPTGSPTTPPPAGDGTTPTSASRPMSTTDLPTLTRPTAPPSEPSDRITGLWVVGTVTQGGDGPCYTLAGEDGQTYLVSGSGGSLAAGDRVKMRVVQPPRPVYCGTAEAWSLQEVQPAG